MDHGFSLRVKGVQIFLEHSSIFFCADGFAPHCVVGEQTDFGLDAFSWVFNVYEFESWFKD